MHFLHYSCAILFAYVINILLTYGITIFIFVFCTQLPFALLYLMFIYVSFHFVLILRYHDSLMLDQVHYRVCIPFFVQ